MLYALDSELTENEAERAYQNYMTDGLTALLGGEKKVPRFADLRNFIYGIEVKTPQADDRTAEQIIADTMKAHNITIIQEEAKNESV